MPTVKDQLKPIILKSLRITDMTPEDLRDDQPLLGGELEIDSVADILQLACLRLRGTSGIKLVEANFDQKHFESLNTLASIIESKVAAVRTLTPRTPPVGNSTFFKYPCIALSLSTSAVLSGRQCALLQWLLLNRERGLLFDGRRKLTRWYEHRFHNITAQRIIFVIIPRVPRLLHPPIAVVTALIFFVL